MSIFANFGAAATNAANTPGGNVFGGTTTTQPTQPSLFGNTSNTNTTATNTTGGGLFGNTNSTANTAGGGLFGNTGNTSNATGGGLFGNTNNTTNTAGGGLFGSTNNASNTTGGGLFGNTNNTTNTAGGGLFGSANTNTNATTVPANTGGNIFGGGFGTTNNNNTSTTGGGLFGGQTAPAAGSSLFSANTNTNANAGGGLFGHNNNATTGSNLFGNTQNNANMNNTAGGGLFGGGSTNTTGGLFGGATSTNAGGGLFGGSTTNNNTNANGQQPATTGGLFGNTQTSNNLFGAKPLTGGGAFGSSTSTASTNPLLGGSLFGQPQQQPQQQQQSSLFGSTSAPGQMNVGLTASALGPPSNLLISRSMGGIQQTSTDPNVQFARTAASIEAIYNAWNPTSKDCRFQTYFYNIVDPNQVNLYGRPANVTNDTLWEKAVRENPDPSCFVPVIAIGFDDIRERIDAQTAQSTAQIQKLADLQTRLTALRTQHSVTNTSRLLRAAAVQTQLAQRVMRFVQHLHLLIPAVRSSALRPEEEKLRRMLEELEEEMRRGRVKSRLNELWALIGAVGASAERSNGGGAGTGGAGEWAVVDEEGLSQIAQILSEQQAGLQYLTKILQKDQKDLDVIFGISNSSQDAEVEEFVMPVDSSDWGSTSTLRASALR